MNVGRKGESGMLIVGRKGEWNANCKKEVGRKGGKPIVDSKVEGT